MVTKESIMDAYVFLRKNNSSIPDETLDFIKYAAIKVLEELEEEVYTYEEIEETYIKQATTKYIGDGGKVSVSLTKLEHNKENI